MFYVIINDDSYLIMCKNSTRVYIILLGIIKLLYFLSKFFFAKYPLKCDIKLFFNYSKLFSQ